MKPPSAFRLWLLLGLIFIAGTGTGMLIWQRFGPVKEDDAEELAASAAADATKPKGPHAKALQTLRLLDQDLDLAKAQRSKVKAVLLAWADELAARPDATAEERLAIFEKHLPPIRAQLRPAQLTRFNEIAEASITRIKTRGEENAAPAPPAQ